MFIKQKGWAVGYPPPPIVQTIQLWWKKILLYSVLVVETVGWYDLLSASTYPVTKSLKRRLISNNTNEIAIDIS